MRASWPADLGRVARQRRLDLAWSQEELAGKAEVTRQWLTRFETGKGDPSLSKALRVLRELRLHLDVTPEERAASVRPRMTVPVYKPIHLDTSKVLSAVERLSRTAARVKAPDGKALSSAPAAMQANMTAALEKLSRSQQQMRARGHVPPASAPASGHQKDPK
jgi:transcriptional regulator with XRE-family HTH domain